MISIIAVSASVKLHLVSTVEYKKCLRRQTFTFRRNWSKRISMLFFHQLPLQAWLAAKKRRVEVMKNKIFHFNLHFGFSFSLFISFFLIFKTSLSYINFPSQQHFVTSIILIYSGTIDTNNRKKLISVSHFEDGGKHENSYHIYRHFFYNCLRLHNWKSY